MSRSGSHTLQSYYSKALPDYNMTSKSMHDDWENYLKKLISLIHLKLDGMKD